MRSATTLPNMFFACMVLVFGCCSIAFFVTTFAGIDRQHSFPGRISDRSDVGTHRAFHESHSLHFARRIFVEKVDDNLIALHGPKLYRLKEDESLVERCWEGEHRNVFRTMNEPKRYRVDTLTICVKPNEHALISFEIFFRFNDIQTVVMNNFENPFHMMRNAVIEQIEKLVTSRSKSELESMPIATIAATCGRHWRCRC